MSTSRNVVLAVNPCHATSAEHAFWTAVAERLTEQGWFLVEIATRLLPYTPHAVSLTLPARLSDLNACLDALPLGSRGGLAPDGWWTETDYAVQEDWEHRRWNLSERLPAALLGSMRLVAFVERVLAEIRPAIVLTTNKIDHGVAHFRRAARRQRLPTAIVERSPLDGIWLEPDGLFAESRIWDLYPSADLGTAGERRAAGRTEVARLVGNPAGLRTAGSDKAALDLAALPKPLVLLPMDNVLWTGWEQYHHPMRPVDNPLYGSPGEAMQHLADLVRDRGGSLVIKPHPACLAIRADSIPQEAHFLASGLEGALEEADLVACFNTKVAFPALAMGKPVLTMSPNPIAASNATYHCRLPAEVPIRFEEALDGGHNERIERFDPFVGWLALDYLYSTDEPAPPHTRGPTRFVADVLAAALEPGVWADPEVLDAAVTEILSGTGGRWIGPPDTTPSSDASARRRSSSTFGKGWGILRERGPTALARKIIFRAIDAVPPQRAGGFVSILERLGVDVGELKAKSPYLVRYRHRWRPLRRPRREQDDFIRLWTAGLGPHSRLAAPACAPDQGERWNRLRGRFIDRTLWVIPEIWSAAKVRSIVPDEEDTFVVSGPELREDLGWQPTFVTTVDWALIGQPPLGLPRVGESLMLPQQFQGLFGDGSTLWFGPHPLDHCGDELSPDTRFSADVVEGLFYEDLHGLGGIRAVLQIACFLGYSEVRVLASGETLSASSWWPAYVAEMAARGTAVSAPVAATRPDSREPTGHRAVSRGALR